MTFPRLLPALLAIVASTSALRPADNAAREEHLMIPMRDGVRLSAVVFFPAGVGPWPVIVEQRYLPNSAPSAHRELEPLARAGFVAASVNFRGAQRSEGHWQSYRALGWGEHQDGYDLVEWFARQRWSTGNVGTIGGSQAGFAQNFLAVTRPPHLVCQYMTDTALSLFQDTFRRGGATWPQRYRQVDTVVRDPEDNHAYIAETFRHPTYDDYWRAVDCYPHFAEMNVPCVTMGSWYDYMCASSIASFVGRQERGGPQSRGHQQLILGPWLHGGRGLSLKVGELVYPANSAFPYWDHVVRWFDHYLKGADNGVERESAIRYYVMGALGERDAPGNAWRTAASWPVASQATPYYLQAGGGLSREEPIGGGQPYTAYRSDPQHPMALPYAMFPGARDARGFEEQSDVRTFTTAVLTEPVEWTGKVRAELFVASTARDTDFIVRVSDVYPDGRSILLMDFVRRARFRDGWDHEALMEPGRIYPVSLDVGWVSQIFNRGHRIRITVASTGAPFYEPNPQTGAPLAATDATSPIVATNRIYHERQHASRLIAPVATAAERR